MKKWYDEEYEWEIEVSGDSKYTKDVVCPDGCVLFRMTAKKLGNKNFFKGKFWD